MGDEVLLQPPPPYISSQSQKRGSHTTLTGRPSPPYQSTCVQSDRPGRTARSAPPHTLTQRACRRSQRTHSPQLQLALHCSNTSPPPLLTGSSRNEQEKRRVEHLSKDSSSSRREGSGSKDPRNPVSAGSPKGGSHSVSGSQPKS